MNTVLEKYRKLPWGSTLLVTANIVIFVICTFTGEKIYKLGMLDAYDVTIKGEYGRLLWAMFLHSGVTHLFNNMLILAFLGAMLEKEMGHWRFLMCYFVSGIGGNLFSLTSKLIANDWTSSLGASGAVFGLDGVLLALVLFYDKKMTTITPSRVAIMILLSLYSGFTGDNIDNAAHIGGLVTGFLIATILCIIRRKRLERRKNR